MRKQSMEAMHAVYTLGFVIPALKVLTKQVRTIERVCEIPHEGPFCDLMWSDPEDLETWSVSPR